MKALHIEPSLANWTICAGGIKYERDMSYSAPKLYAQMKDKYKILVYNGDTDMACDYVADSWAVDAINATVNPKHDWTPWKIKAHNNVNNSNDKDSNINNDNDNNDDSNDNNDNDNTHDNSNSKKKKKKRPEAADGEQTAGFLTMYDTKPGMFFVTGLDNN